MLICANFHYVRPEYKHPYPSFFGVTPDQFASRLDLLGRVGSFVGAEEVRAAIRGERALPKRAWLVTFDDGLREQFEHAWPILHARGIPAVFFVNTHPIRTRRVEVVHQIHQLRAHVAPERLLAALHAHAARLGIRLGVVDDALAARQYKYDTPDAARLKYLLNIALERSERDSLVESCFAELAPRAEAEIADELYMSVEQVRTLAAHDCIGTHGHQHLPLGTLPRTEIERQMRTSLDLLRAWTGRDVDALSFPYGAPEACGETAGEVAAEAGIGFSFTMERAGNPTLDAPHFIARCDNNDLPGGKAPRWGIDRVFEEVPVARWCRPAFA